MSEFSSLKIVGGLLSSDLLSRVFAGDSNVPGTSPESYGLERGESVRRQASRSWPYLLETWQDEKKRDRFARILLRELGFDRQMPDHMASRLLSWDTDLDHRTPNREARAPQSVMQQQLNEDDSRLWGLLTNGTTLRLLRDSATLVGSTYVEFDLKAIFDGELFSDFVLLYLVCHETRWSGDPCFLEQWREYGDKQGERVLDQLRQGVQKAISILGTGFISNPANPQLRNQLANNELRLDDLNRALLRLVYRMLFWFVAEDRDALLIPEVPRETRDRYEGYFSATRLRKLARQQRGTRHSDLFEVVRLVFEALGAEGGVPELGLPGIGGIFETGALDAPVIEARLSNEALLGAIRALSLFHSKDGGATRRVDFTNLGAEELGSIYESLLELVPQYDADDRTYTLTVLPGNERKESGSYYTPSSLVECLLDSALDPLLDEATSKGTDEDKVAALLDLTVCDPACGSGHFLVAAARRIAKRIAAIETDESQPPEPAVRKALRQVVGRCIYGVDVNPMAAELAKVSLWLEALEPGKPLSYLDQNIRVGNSLLGTTPALLAEGLPDEAFKAIEGDDKKVCTALKKQNAAERAGQGDLFSPSGIPVSNSVLAKRADSITHTLPDSLEDLHIHQQREADQLDASAERRVQKLLADAWCAAFVQRKTERTRPIAITQATIESFASDDRSLDLGVSEDLVAEFTRQYRFFHWHIEFPHIFPVGAGPNGWSGGFSCVLGNPPWERVKLEEQEFFASRSEEISDAPTAATRKRLIAELNQKNPSLHEDFQKELRKSLCWSFILHESGRYPLTGHGDINTYAPFSENSLTLISPTGRSGIIVPTGIATGFITQAFFKELVSSRRLVSLFDFENSKPIFPSVHRSYKFCLLVSAGSLTPVTEASFAFFCSDVKELTLPEKQFRLTAQEIMTLNPNTGTCPVFRCRRDADLSLGASKNFPIMNSENFDYKSLRQQISRFGDLSDLNRGETKGNLRRTGIGPGWIDVYEAKLFHQFNHRLASYNNDDRLAEINRADPDATATPRIWIREPIAYEHYGSDWPGWVIAYRDIARATDERTMIAAARPRSACDYTVKHLASSWDRQVHLLAALNSFIYDYLIRLRNNGTHVSTFITYQVPIPPDSIWESSSEWIGRPVGQWMLSRTLELAFTSWDMEPFARYLGDDGPPFRWDEERRFVMRCELDALFFHLYDIARDDVDYIMETFPIVKRKDIAAHGTYRTKDQILEIYDAMTGIADHQLEHSSQLKPPPGDGPRHPSYDQR